MAKILSSAKQAEFLKDQGNVYFKKDRLAAAIDAYTEAITLCPNVSVYWTNRALCRRKRNEWDRVEADCRKALELDNNSVKAHYMLGLALLHYKQYPEAVKQLEKALELGRGASPTSYMVEEIWQALGKAKYTEWEAAATPRKSKQNEIRELCERAVKLEYEKAIAEKTSAHAGAYSAMEDVIVIEGDGEDASKDWNISANLRQAYQEKLQVIAEIFNKAAEADRPSEIPEYLCCKITMDLFRDPVITPSGVTYERAILLEHLRKVGKFDPLTRAPLEPEQIAPNLALKEAVQAYLSEHGWAYIESANYKEQAGS